METTILVIATIFLLVILAMVGVFAILAVKNIKANDKFSTDSILQSCSNYMIAVASIVWISVFLSVIASLVLIYQSLERINKSYKIFIMVLGIIFLGLLVISGVLSSITAVKLSTSVNYQPAASDTDKAAHYYASMVAGFSLGITGLLIIFFAFWYSWTRCDCESKSTEMKSTA